MLDTPFMGGKIVPLTSSGFLVKHSFKFEDKQVNTVVITNAHAVKGCVADPKSGLKIVELSSHDGVVFKGRVICICGSSDLAIILPQFSEGMSIPEGIELKGNDAANISQYELPKFGIHDTSCLVYGFPLGENSISVTKGRITSHVSEKFEISGQVGLVWSTDAIVQPGNSGGGVFNQKTGELLGIIFEGRDRAGTTYIITPYTLKTVLHNFSLLCASGLQSDVHLIEPLSFNVDFQEVNDADTRSYLEIDSALKAMNYATKGRTLGVRVKSVAQMIADKTDLREGDVIYEVFGCPLLSNGNIVLKNTPISIFSVLMDLKKDNSSVQLKVLRKENNKVVSRDVVHQCQETTDLVAKELNIEPAEFAVLGPFVFQELDLTRTLTSIQKNEANIPMLKSTFMDQKSAAGQECIVVTHCLVPSIEYHQMLNVPIAKVNGISVDSVLSALVAAQMSDTRNPGYLTVETGTGELLAWGYEEPSFHEFNRKLFEQIGVSRQYRIRGYSDSRVCDCANISRPNLCVQNGAMLCSDCKKQLAMVSCVDDQLKIEHLWTTNHMTTLVKVEDDFKTKKIGKLITAKISNPLK